jgi:hypothetical protein
MSRKRQKPQRETDLYAPVRDWLKAQGYTVRGEVRGCDITAVHDDELIIIELKRAFNLDLLLQVTQRQRMADSVYAAVPRPAKWWGNRRWRQIKHLLRRLETGLIFVNFDTAPPMIEVVFHPQPFQPRRRKKDRRAILREMNNRSHDLNPGGSTQRKLMTAYRQKAIHIACCLENTGPAAPKDLRDLGADSKTGAILYANHYGWFNRIGHGLYDLSGEGRKALEEWPEMARHYRSLLKSRQEPGDNT